MNTFQQEYNGRAEVSDWNMIMNSRREGKTMNFEAHFQAVKGGRLLYLNNRAGEEYLLVRVK